MAVARVLRATGCPNCRVSLLWSFASLAGPSIRAPHISTRLQRPISYSRIRFSSNVTREDDGHRGIIEARGRNVEAEDVEEVKDVEDVQETPKTDGESVEVTAVPWYLQVDAPQRMPQTLSERQKIPDLPESPPAILQPLLQQLSVDLGLDNLSLLDLRKLDPPPALGSNLMMVLGTARSEKHLHVSADRLCRWLRSKYKLRPDADGLLGRNELKLKLRRKSRKAKLLGSAADENEDDGVRTGWVCVDVGVVEGEGPVTHEPEPQDFIGFGRRTDGVRMVVQMLTEEKREEIDLERLWGGILKRGGTQQQIESSGQVGIESIEPSGSAVLSGTAKRIGNTPSSIPPLSRGFHTSACRASMQVETQATVADSFPGQLPTSNIGQTSLGLNDIRQSVMQRFASGDFNLTKAYFLPLSQDVPLLQGEGWRPFLLEQLRVYLESIPRDRAISLLSKDPTDHDTTPFLASFYQTLSAALPEAQGDALVCLHCYAIEIDHPDYTFFLIIALLNEMQTARIPMSSRSYLRLLKNALSSHHDKGAGNFPRPVFIKAALKVLAMMHDQGHKVVTEEIFLALQEAIAWEETGATDPSLLPRRSLVSFHFDTIHANGSAPASDTRNDDGRRHAPLPRRHPAAASRLVLPETVLARVLGRMGNACSPWGGERSSHVCFYVSQNRRDRESGGVRRCSTGLDS
jgi:hypothetical protein